MVKSQDPDSDHLRGGPSYGYYLCKKIKPIGAIVFLVMHPVRHTDRQTDTDALPMHSTPGARVTTRFLNVLNIAHEKQNATVIGMR